MNHKRQEFGWYHSGCTCKNSVSVSANLKHI